MTTIYHTDHPHYAVHKAFIEGSFANPDCPPVVQFKWVDGWEDSPDPVWNPVAQYRIKPRTITRTVTYPEPLWGAPARHTSVWIVSPYSPRPETVNWGDASYHRMALKNGMVFTTQADAQACYDAFFGEQK